MINGRLWDISSAGKASGGLQHLDKALLKSLGIDDDKVGMQGVMPSIGSTGKALPF